MGIRVWETGVLILVVVWGRLACAADPSRLPFSSPTCHVDSMSDSIFGFRDWNCPVNSDSQRYDFHGVTEGNELSLQRALNMVHKNHYDYVAVLFYASWCPFSKTFSPSFSVLASLYPSIPHFSIEESIIRPSILSKYGVHGFPTLFLLNSTMRVRYYGSRSLGSLIAFYNDVTGIKTESLDQMSLNRVSHPSNQEKQNNFEQENCPFSWARSPENFEQETYLALATAFVLLRLIYFFYPTLCLTAQYAWRSYFQNLRLQSLWEHSLMFFNRARQLLSSLNEPCRRSNLQGGALNARAWASKSLATVSIGDASSSRCVPVGDSR